jgi:hypothetical protein
MQHISSYCEVYQLGHRSIKDIFSSEVVLEEKIDGSSFSFGVLGDELVCRSKGKQLIVDAPEKMFTKAIATAQRIMPELHKDWIYRGEFLEKPKHNTLKYSRVPDGNIIIYDIMVAPEDYLGPQEKVEECRRLGLECVPLLAKGKIDNLEMFKEFLEQESILGGTKIEGIVIKNYSLFTQSKKAMMGKYVSEAFKEVHDKDWKTRNPHGKDLVFMLTEKYHTEARWQKAIQHLRDAGALEGSPKDIGLLIREVPADILKECETEIRDVLFKHFWPQIARGVTRGLPEFYKEQLAESTFQEVKE